MGRRLNPGAERGGGGAEERFNPTDRHGQNWATPLYLASENGHAEVVERLAKAGADASAKTNVSGGGGR
jgi:hypothetical protein